MKNFIIAAMLGVAASAGADCAYATMDGDHEMRPRPEYDPLQQDILFSNRVMLVDGIKLYKTQTTNFGRYGFANLTESAEPELVFAP